jgi:hypothetical protein
MRLIASTVISLLANLVGLLVADALLDDMEVTASGFVVALVVFTLTSAIIQPFIQKVALTKQSALVGGTALVASLVGLIVADVVSDGISISGASTWLLAAVIVWGASLLAAMLLPLIIFKRTLEARRD